MAEPDDEAAQGRQPGMWAAFSTVARAGTRETARFIAIIAVYGVMLALVSFAVGSAGTLASVIAAIAGRR
ncbi:hypothetical protein [Leifsonia sp. TF02-11]|uniref:hypothetical protein n=1 Tax=Leifsonia sp. TF02-11 TaxID=2815212 RepID=UPI001AA1D188|nr:hypothetical protein [Leifsonia sp. TF02-11]MBO1739567.1 hypothetical protein [Leifsonia sp. TF02-11]